MPVPSFDNFGLLPAGVHHVTFAEIETALCWNPHRQALWSDFQRFLADKADLFLVAGTPFYIDGSFVRRKESPADIDVVIDLSNCSDDLVRTGYLLRFDYDQIKAVYHVDLWLKHPKIPLDLSAFFQYAGEKCAIEMSIDPKHPKGILRATS
jgi:hypothetical protein